MPTMVSRRRDTIVGISVYQQHTLSSGILHNWAYLESSLSRCRWGVVVVDASPNHRTSSRHCISNISPMTCDAYPVPGDSSQAYGNGTTNALDKDESSNSIITQSHCIVADKDGLPLPLWVPPLPSPPPDTPVHRVILRLCCRAHFSPNQQLKSICFITQEEEKKQHFWSRWSFMGETANWFLLLIGRKIVAVMEEVGFCHWSWFFFYMYYRWFLSKAWRYFPKAAPCFLPCLFVFEFWLAMNMAPTWRWWLLIP